MLRVNLFYFLNKIIKQMSEEHQLLSQDFLEQANSKEKTFGHNKFQLEIQNYESKVLNLEHELSLKIDKIEELNKQLNQQVQNYENLQKHFNDVKQTYENRISNLNVQYENLKKQLQQQSDENKELLERYKLEYPKVTDLYKDIDKLKQDLEIISLDRDNLLDKLNKFTQMYDDQNKKLDETNEKCSQFTNELNLQKSISNSLEKEIDILKIENTNYKTKIEDLQILLDEKENEINTNNIKNLNNIVLDENKSNENPSATNSKRIRLYGSRRRKP